MMDDAVDKIVKLLRLYRETVELADICVRWGEDANPIIINDYWEKRNQLDECKKAIKRKVN